MSAAGDWPRTTRLLPWSLALFLVVVFLVPSEAVHFSVPLPIDPTPDRFLFVGIALLLVIGMLMNRERFAPGPARFRLQLGGAPALPHGPDQRGRQRRPSRAHRRLRAANQAACAVGVQLRALLRRGRHGAADRAQGVRDADGRARVADGRGNLCGSTAPTPTSSTTPLPRSSARSRRSRPRSRDQQKTAGRHTTGPTQHGLAVTSIVALMLPFALLGAVRRPQTLAQDALPDRRRTAVRRLRCNVQEDELRGAADRRVRAWPSIAPSRSWAGAGVAGDPGAEPRPGAGGARQRDAAVHRTASSAPAPPSAAPPTTRRSRRTSPPTRSPVAATARSRRRSRTTTGSSTTSTSSSS